MATAIHVYVRGQGAAADAPLAAEIVFYGRTEADAEARRQDFLQMLGGSVTEDRLEESVDDTLDDEDIPDWETVTGGDDEDDDGDPDADSDEDDETADDED